MNKISKSIVGYPLKQTSPAGIEKELVTRIRNDLGEFSDLALIKPVLKVDSEDGDLSGNVTNAYGTILIRVLKKDLHIPFIIYQKELLPFDIIRMGEDEVAYDMSKLRQIVNNLDKAQRQGSDDGEFEQVVPMTDVPTQNGFLGNIMRIRDEYQNFDPLVGHGYADDSFGIMDQGRMERMASATVDVGDVFEEFHEKLANVQVFSTDAVKQVANDLEEKFAKEAQTAIDLISKVDVPTKTTIEVERGISEMSMDSLMNASAVASGNNVRFPVFTDNTLEYRLGRVYNQLKPLVDRALNSKFKRLVMDNRGEYALLENNEKFMVSQKEPAAFDMLYTRAKAMFKGRMYTLEASTSEVYAPFEVTAGYLERYEELTALTAPERALGVTFYKIADSDLLRDIFICKQALPSRRDTFKPHEDLFMLVILKQSDNPFQRVTLSELKEVVTAKEATNQGVSTANYVIEKMMWDLPIHGGGKEPVIYVVGDTPTVFMPLTHRIEGFFSRPDAFLQDTKLFDKTASYDKYNKARLFVEQGTRPATYRLEWEFSIPQGEGETKMEKRVQEGLAPAQAKALLTQLGFDERKKESFFQIVKQNGRMAEFSLPDAELAAKVAPEDKGRNKAAEFVKGLVDTSLNAGNFVPSFKDTLSTSLTDTITPIAGAAAMSPKGEILRNTVSGIFNKEAETSYEVAVELEKVAEKLRGPEWFKVAQLVNMKHHLDKLAYETTNGFVKEAEAVWSTLPQLDTEIAKVAKSLILFNREQMMKTSANLVPGGLVKEAVNQLDGLAKYSSVAKELMNRLNFFSQPAQAGRAIQKLEDDFKNLSQNYNAIRKDLMDNEYELRAAVRTGLEGTDPETVNNLKNAINEKAEQADNLLQQMSQAKREQGQILGELEQGNRKKVIGLAAPLSFLTGAGFGAIGTKE